MTKYNTRRKPRTRSNRTRSNRTRSNRTRSNRTRSTFMAEFETYSLGDVKLQRGSILRDAKLAYKTYGSLNEDKSNVIVYPSWYSGFISDNEWLIGEGMALDPTLYFIIVPCALGNGQSSSPSNTPSPYGKSRFPNITLYDNVTLQYRLVTELFGITKIKLVVGWSMGAQQTYQWGCLYPNMVERIAPFCGSAKTAPHNFVFLEGVRVALTNDAAWNHGFYETQPEVGLRGVARVYAGWGFSQPFYKQEQWRALGYHSLEDFLIGFWEGFFLKRDANNLLTMLWSWQNADISDNDIFKGDLSAALSAIQAKAIVMPAQIDLYFPPDDNVWEISQMTSAAAAELIVIPGVWGHFAGGGCNVEDTLFIDKELKRLLADKVDNTFVSDVTDITSNSA